LFKIPPHHNHHSVKPF